MVGWLLQMAAGSPVSEPSCPRVLPALAFPGAVPLPLTFRNLCRRKANQLVSIFSATDSVLQKMGRGRFRGASGYKE